MSPLEAEQQALMTEFARLSREGSPDSEEAFVLVRAWQKFLCRYFDDCPDYVLFTLGRAYLEPDVALKIDEYGIGTARFMSDALAALETACAGKDGSGY